MREPDPRLAAMRGDVGGIAWPPLFSGRLAPLAATIHQLDLSQWLPAEQIAERQWSQLRQLAAHYAQHSAVFRDRLASGGLAAADLRSAEALRAVPPLTRKALQSVERPVYVEQLPPHHGPAQKNQTSGSTGEPVVVLRTAVSQLHWLALTMRYHLWSEPNFAGRIATVRANLRQPGEDKNWGAPVSFFFDSGAGLKIDIQVDLKRQIEMLRAFGPDSLVIYPSNLAAILDELQGSGGTLPTLKRVRTIGEMLPPGLRGRVEAELGATLYDCYSSQELGYVALQCPESDLYHVMSETVIVEVVDDRGRPSPEGEAGRVLVTDLHNHATPLIRYQIGDYAEAGPPCPCGRGLPTLRRILGRERNLIVKPDGSRHWPLTGFKRFREIAPIAQYQMRQHEIDRIELRLVVERPLTAEEEAALRAWLGEMLHPSFRFDFVYFEGRLPTGPNGKFEEFMSLL